MNELKKTTPANANNEKAHNASNPSFGMPTPEQIEAIASDFITKGLSFRQIRGLTQENMEAVYSVGFTLYNNGRFEDAEKIFQFLSIFDHLVRKYWMALAGAQQMLKKYSKALDAYSYCAILDMQDLWAPFHAAECHMALKDQDKAKKALEAALELSGKDQELKERIQGMLNLLHKK